jgi:alkylation response protein AidB-like acyl-CoA dehydrogenase
MDFVLTSEQQALNDSVARFCERNYTGSARHDLINSDTGFSSGSWQSFAELGWLGAGLSESEGGFGGGAVENAVIMENFGRSLVLEPFLSTSIHGLQTLLGTKIDKVRSAMVEAIAAGEMFLSVAHSEPASHGDLSHCETIARKSGTTWTISGHKSVVQGGPSASKFLVSAQADEGIALFLVDAAADGIIMRSYRTLDNHRVADIWFNAAEAELMLADASYAPDAIQRGFDHALLGVCAEAVGAMDVAISTTRDYLKTRQQFGMPIGNFQALQHRMADMFVEYELSRSILYAGLAAMARNKSERAKTISAMKGFVSSAALFIGRNAVQLHGGIGVTEECAISHYYRRLFVISMQFGNESYHLQQMAKNPIPFWHSKVERGHDEPSKIVDRL